MNLKAIIVDDEVGAREILEQLLARFCPDVEIVDKCNDVESAVKQINNHQPDLVFLDVEMPKYAGYEIEKFFDVIDFNIIFITAYDKYAVKAFEVSAIDYLLKPIEISRLQSAVEKVKRQVVAKSYKEKLSMLSNDLKKSDQKYSYSDRGFTNYIAIDEIIAFEAQRAYTLMHLQGDKSITISKNIKTVLGELAEFTDFSRVHRSWIINKIHLVKYSRSSQDIFLSNNVVAKISRQNKIAFDEIISNG